MRWMYLRIRMVYGKFLIANLNIRLDLHLATDIVGQPVQEDVLVTSFLLGDLNIMNIFKVVLSAFQDGQRHHEADQLTGKKR